MLFMVIFKQHFAIKRPVATGRIWPKADIQFQLKTNTLLMGGLVPQAGLNTHDSHKSGFRVASAIAPARLKRLQLCLYGGYISIPNILTGSLKLFVNMLSMSNVVKNNYKPITFKYCQ